MIIAANWKAYVDDTTRAKKLVTVAKKIVSGKKVDVILAPSAPLLGLLAAGNRSKVAFASQDISTATFGAATGETVARAIQGAGATYTIIGHSERRALGETNDVVAQKMALAFSESLTPILCVGERERDSEGQYLSFIREEIVSALTPLSVKERAQVVIAYEPIWAIGKSGDQAIHAEELHEMELYIRKVLAELTSERQARAAVVLYGGSVDPENIRALAASTSINGFLVGRASVDPATFAALAKALS